MPRWFLLLTLLACVSACKDSNLVVRSVGLCKEIGTVIGTSAPASEGGTQDDRIGQAMTQARRQAAQLSATHLLFEEPRVQPNGSVTVACTLYECPGDARPVVGELMHEDEPRRRERRSSGPGTYQYP